MKGCVYFTCSGSCVDILSITFTEKCEKLNANYDNLYKNIYILNVKYNQAIQYYKRRV